jgi:hypothetical protein
MVTGLRFLAGQSNQRGNNSGLPPPITSAGIIQGRLSNDLPTSTLIETATPAVTPLPLFATTLGALGLFGWHRMRKTQRLPLALDAGKRRNAPFSTSA